MKTRIIYTKIHFEDDWFNTLPIGYRYLFIYLFTNTHIGMTGIYELTDRVAMLESGADKKTWESACKKFEEDKKAVFYKNWVCVINAGKYNNQLYSGEKNEIAYKKEIEAIPADIIRYLDTLSIPYAYHYYHNHNHYPYNKGNHIKEEDLKLDDIKI